MSGALAPAARPSRAPARVWTPRGRYPLAVALLAAAYYGAAQLGYALEFAGPVAAIVWLPVGVGIAVLYLGGLGCGRASLIGDLLANDYRALPLGSALGQTCGNVLEVLVAALLLRRARPARLAARERRRRRPHGRRDRRRHGGERHGRRALAAGSAA